MEERTIIIKKGSISSLFTGIAIGAGLALLFAPRSGRDTRDMLTEKGSHLRDRAVEIASDTRHRAVEIANDTRTRAQHSFEEARNKIEEKVKSVKEGAMMTAEEENRQLKRELEIMEDVNNPSFPL